MTDDELPALLMEGSTPIRDRFLDAVLSDPGVREATRHFLTTKLANSHTRDNYVRTTIDFLRWSYDHRCPVHQVTTEVLGHYRDHLIGVYDTPTVHNKLSGLSRYFKHLVAERVITQNRVAGVERPKLDRCEGTTPLIPSDVARKLRDSIELRTAVDYRDRAIIGCLTYTAARVGAIAAVRVDQVGADGNQRALTIIEKRGKRRVIPLRHDLELWVSEYMAIARLGSAGGDAPLFRTAVGRTGRLTERGTTRSDIHRMLKRRLRRAGLPSVFSSHSFRAMVTTDLLEQGVPIEDVAFLLGHADVRTTSLYDRRSRRVTRNLVERISA